MYDLIMQVYATVLLPSSWNYVNKRKREMAQLIKKEIHTVIKNNDENM